MLFWVYNYTDTYFPALEGEGRSATRQTRRLGWRPHREPANGKQAPALNATGQRETAPQEPKNKYLVY